MIDAEDPETQDETESEDGDEALQRKLKAWETRAKSHWSKWRKEARDCYAFVSGDQWSADDKAAMLEEMRVPVTFNRTGPMVDAVTGAEILNRQEVRYVPREQGDVQVNEVITAAAEWAREGTDAEDEESDAFHDTIVCGLGWVETRMDYETDPEGLIRLDRVDPLEMYADPAARKRNLADARYFFRARWRDKAELPAEWRKKMGSRAEGAGDTDDMRQGQSGPQDDYERGEDETGSRDEPDKNRVWVKHFQWWELEDAYKISDPMTGQSATLDAEKYKAVVTMHLKNMMQPPEAAKIKTRKYYQAFLAGDTLLESGPIPCNAFTVHAITGKRDRNAGTWYGIVRAMRDPQMWANKWLSQILHILNTSAKGGAFFEENTFVNERKAKEDWAKPDAMIALKTGALARGAFQERTAKNYPQGLDRLMEFAVNSMPQVTGINLELLGLVQKEQAGVLEAQRKQAGYAIIAVFFDALRRYRKMQGRVMLHYIQHYISDGRLIRIMGKNGNEQFVPLVRQKDTATYDVIVDDAPMSANQKEAVWGMLTQMMPVMMKQPVPAEVWAEFIKYSPLPTSIGQKIAKAITDAAQPDPMAQQMQQAGAQLELRKSEADAAVAESQAMLNQARAQGEAVKMMTPPRAARAANQNR